MDDWLHRGPDLQDMDQYHYARYIERVELPRCGTAQTFQKAHGAYHLFDAHYPISKQCAQILRRHARTVQTVGPQCLRSDVNQGEDNAAYKAFYFTCMHCTGPGNCANPVICLPALFPGDGAHGHEEAPTPRRFAPSWRARRAEIEILADRASAKRALAKRILVPHDTTAFKGAPLDRGGAAEPPPAGGGGSAAEPPAAGARDATPAGGPFETRLRQVLLQLLLPLLYRQFD